MKKGTVVVLGLLGVVGCTTIRASVPFDSATGESGAAFSHDELDRALGKHVDREGRVSYLSLRADRGDLDRYFASLAAYSPDSHPAMFPSTESQLAYWVNAYNASVLEAVLQHYPIRSVRDVKPPVALFFLPRLSGFFVFQRVILGGEKTSLYDLENEVVRKRFPEPRVHFALNCASLGCPRLPREAFTPARLEEQLDREARRFFAEDRNLRIDHDRGEVYLSKILEWYEEDFTGWFERAHPGRKGSLLDYALLYVEGSRAEGMRWAHDSGYAVRFAEYNWTLNDARPPLGSP